MADTTIGPGKVKKNAPVLPWMRVPVTIEAGTGVALPEVLGLCSNLQEALAEGGSQPANLLQTAR